MIVIYKYKKRLFIGKFVVFILFSLLFLILENFIFTGKRKKLKIVKRLICFE